MLGRLQASACARAHTRAAVQLRTSSPAAPACVCVCVCLCVCVCVCDRAQPSRFPCLFGPGGTEGLDVDAARCALAALADAVNAAAAARGGAEPPRALSVEEVAAGFIRVADEAMCRPIRGITQMRGYDAVTHTLACFGGAGGQHACGVARALGMKTIFISRFAGILSAYGMALADVVHETQEPCAEVLWRPPADCAPCGTLDEGAARALGMRLAGLVRRAAAGLAADGYTGSAASFTAYLNIRWVAAARPAPPPARVVC